MALNWRFLQENSETLQAASMGDKVVKGGWGLTVDEDLHIDGDDDVSKDSNKRCTYQAAASFST